MRIDCLIVHSIPGRVRYRISHKAMLVHHAQRLASHLLGREGTTAVRINVNCGSVIVEYDPFALTAETLAVELTRFLESWTQSSSGMVVCVPSPCEVAKASEAEREVATISQTCKTLFRGILDAARRDHDFVIDWEGRTAGPRHVLEQTATDRNVHDHPDRSDWHQLEIWEVVESLGSELRTGLHPREAAERLTRFGPNALGRLNEPSPWGALAHQFTSLPVALLLGSAAISVMTAGLVDAVVILGVVTVNACIGYVTESQAEKTIASLQDESDAPATVIRNGQKQELATESIVPGDLILLVPGATVPADLRLIETQRLMIDESALTGESMPVAKSAGRITIQHVPLRDRQNMVYRGTLVTGGSGLGVAVATGERTEVGLIQNLVGAAKAPPTPVQRQLGAMGTQLGLLSGAICGGIFVLGLYRRYGVIEMLKTATSLAVAAIPEGLPMVATTTLALGVGRMRRLNVAVRRLDAIETLGSVDVFCLDKTGTLTLNQMRVVRLFVGSQTYEATDEHVLRDFYGRTPAANADHRRLIEVGALCNEAKLLERDGRSVLQGSPTESSLIRLALDQEIPVQQLRRSNRVLRTEYRTESRGYMSTLHQSDSGEVFWALKGRPGEVLELCNWKLADGKRVKLTSADRVSILAENEAMAGQALRVLGVACSSQVSHEPSTVSDLTWLGLIGIADPVRPGTRDLMQVFHRAGIRTVMITGDQSVTANAIGHQLRLNQDPELRTIDSTELESLAPDVLRSLAQNVHVFSSVTPSHKLAIVQALQRAGKVVAMTGDGINDGPALKAANIGVAMGGDRGTDVARMTADVVLEDNNLQSMVAAIAQGRAIYSNTRNAIRYLISTNMSEIMVMGTAVAAGKGAPLNPIQLLWINLVSDIFPVIALAIQPPEPDVLNRPPRSVDEPLLNRRELGNMLLQASVITAGTFGSYAWGRFRYASRERASTMAFISITTAQLLHMLGCRSERHSIFSADAPEMNTFLKAGLAIGIGLQGATIAFQPLRRLLKNTPLSPLDLAVSVIGAGLPAVMNEAIKYRRLSHHDAPRVARELDLNAVT